MCMWHILLEVIIRHLFSSSLMVLLYGRGRVDEWLVVNFIVMMIVNWTHQTWYFINCSWWKVQCCGAPNDLGNNSDDEPDALMPDGGVEQNEV